MLNNWNAKLSPLSMNICKFSVPELGESFSVIELQPIKSLVVLESITSRRLWIRIK